MTVEIDPTDGLGQTELLRRLQGVAEKAVQEKFGNGCDIQHINQSENTTYKVTDANGAESILRIHRTGYHSLAAIKSEHAWMTALREDADVRTPRLLNDVQHIVTSELPEGRQCVFFEHLEGDEPDPDDLAGNFPNLGEVTARMHEHALSWQLPRNFERFTWNCDTVFGDSPHWGHWHSCPWVDDESRQLLQRLADALQLRLNQFGHAKERFGLVHADMRLANLLVHEGETRVIDFDDCGMSWYLYDLATALSFLEDLPNVMELVDAWLSGYRRVRDVSQTEVDEIPTFLMLRRMLAIAWIGSHSETELAQELGPDFIQATMPLAEKFLSGTWKA
jgi:Ser/Thr protein kinase RdoA (MazF antagonist)